MTTYPETPATPFEWGELFSFYFKISVPPDYVQVSGRITVPPDYVVDGVSLFGYAQTQGGPCTPPYSVPNGLIAQGFVPGYYETNCYGTFYETSQSDGTPPIPPYQDWQAFQPYLLGRYSVYGQGGGTSPGRLVPTYVFPNIWSLGYWSENEMPRTTLPGYNLACPDVHCNGWVPYYQAYEWVYFYTWNIKDIYINWHYCAIQEPPQPAGKPPVSIMPALVACALLGLLPLPLPLPLPFSLLGAANPTPVGAGRRRPRKKTT